MRSRPPEARGAAGRRSTVGRPARARSDDVATRTIQTYTSDLTGTQISNDSERVELRVLDHPDIDTPVRLDAYALDVQGLFDAAERYVTVDVVIPGQRPQRLTLPADQFARVFTADVTETLRTAD